MGMLDKIKGLAGNKDQVMAKAQDALANKDQLVDKAKGLADKAPAGVGDKAKGLIDKADQLSEKLPTDKIPGMAGATDAVSDAAGSATDAVSDATGSATDAVSDAADAAAEKLDGDA